MNFPEGSKYKEWLNYDWPKTGILDWNKAFKKAYQTLQQKIEDVKKAKEALEQKINKNQK